MVTRPRRMSLVGSRGGGLVPVFGTGLLGGIRLTFIGWFLNVAAVLSDRQLVVRESPEHVPAGAITRTHLVSVARKRS